MKEESQNTKVVTKPKTWTDEKKSEAIEKILSRINGGESCRSILDNADRNEYPHYCTFSQWLSEDAEIAKQYAHACEGRAEKIFEEILTISDGGAFDEAINVQRDRLKVDARKWVLAKLAPKKYGDKMEVDNTHTINSVSLKELVNFK